MKPDEDAVITASDLSKSFRDHIAVCGLDLAVPRGSVYGLIGRNGAGKTTTLRMLMGLVRPKGGSARVLGHDLWSAALRNSRAGRLCFAGAATATRQVNCGALPRPFPAL